MISGAQVFKLAANNLLSHGPVAGRFLPTLFFIPSCIWQQAVLKKYLVIERANGSLYSFVIFLFKRDLKEVVRYTVYSIQSCFVLDFKDRTRFAEIPGLDLHLQRMGFAARVAFIRICD